jgi:transposase, IS30 family
MRKGDKKLDLAEREQLAILKAQGKSLREIGRVLGRSHSSLSRELRRHNAAGSSAHYSPCSCHEIAILKRGWAGRKKGLRNPAALDYIEAKLKLGWSPELISGRMERDLGGYRVSHETIYQHIYEDRWDLVGYLPRRHAFRKKRHEFRKAQRSRIPNRLSIEQRPAIVNERRQFGHWESDLIVSGKSGGALNVMVERKSRFVHIARIDDKTSASVSSAIVRCLMRYDQQVRHSITYDNGLENTRHEEINRWLGTTSYFCNPYHSWEKGSVENTNGLIRRFIPKKMDLALVTDADIERIEHLLNTRPKKCLGYQTPQEVLNSYLQVVQ